MRRRLSKSIIKLSRQGIHGREHGEVQGRRRWSVAIKRLSRLSWSFSPGYLLLLLFSNCDSFRNVFAKVEHELNLGPLTFILVVVNVNVSPKLETISDYLLATLRERFFHVIVRSESESSPEGILHTSLRDSHGMIDAIPAALLVNRRFGPQGRCHFCGDNVQGVNLRQLEQSLCNGPFSGLASTGGLMPLTTVVVVPSAL